jgi:oligopeptide/dipeptide ABC transporter ATP-binding protein
MSTQDRTDNAKTTEQRVIEVLNLKTYFDVDEGTLKAVDGVSFTTHQRRTLGIIGESGCGKSITARSILRIVPSPGRIVDGQILLHRNGGDSLDLARFPQSSETVRRVRGKDITMIFQEPMTSLSPIHSVGNQIEESLLLHTTEDRDEARRIAIEMLDKVGIPAPESRIEAYPHQLSGGLRQRVMIAMALACNPKLLIADEPTTALDVTVQAQILRLIRSLQDQFGMAVLYITHDLGVISEVAETVAVMYLGRIVEYTDVRSLFFNPKHPYTVNLLKAIPKATTERRVRLATMKGTVPIPLNLPYQCGFYGRCPQGMEGVCDKAIPELVEIEEGHSVRCFLFHQKREGEPS